MKNSEIITKALEASKYISENTRRGSANYIFINGSKNFLFCNYCDQFIDVNKLTCPKCGGSDNFTIIDESEFGKYSSRSRLRKIDDLTSGAEI